MSTIQKNDEDQNHHGGQLEAFDGIEVQAILVNSFQNILDLLHPVDDSQGSSSSSSTSAASAATTASSLSILKSKQTRPMTATKTEFTDCLHPPCHVKVLQNRTDILSLLSHIRYSLIVYESTMKQRKLWEGLCYNLILTVTYTDPLLRDLPVTLHLVNIMDPRSLTPTLTSSISTSEIIGTEKNVMHTLIK